MFKHFINLQRKSFFRSSSLGKGMALKILMVFFGLYFAVSLASLGFVLYPVLQKLFPDTDPMLKVSEFMAYWILAELLFRYFMQKLPVIDVKPLLLLPIKKDTITHYILGKSTFSFYNFLSLFLFVPFAMVLMTHGYPIPNTIIWLVAIVGIVQTINYVNFIINKSNTYFTAIAIMVGTLYLLELFTVLPVTEFFGTVFYALYENPVLVLVPMALSALAYYANYKYLRNRIFLDASLKRKSKDATTSNLAWTKRFGDIAPFLQLDLKLIWRNKRTKTQLFISLAMVFYGLFFYTMGDFALTSPLMVFVGIFITGVFMINFGQFIPAWDSAYYGMMMSQNIPLRKYLESKAGLISASIVVMFLMSVPYIYFGWQALAINLSSALYNLGINIPMVLFFGSLNKKRIDLNKSAFANMQGTGAAQFLVVLPLFGIPMLIFLGVRTLTSFQTALITLAIMGVVGFLFRHPLLNHITEVYRKKKYGMVAGFKEKSS